MRIAIIGCGVIGVTSAWYLVEAGHEVVVIDRSDGPARETSFANAGQISPGYASPWASPKVPLQLLYWLPQKHSPLVLRPRLDARQISWLLAMLRNCTPAAYSRNKERMVRLAEFSRDQLRQLRSDTGIAYDERSRGTLQLFRTRKQLDAVEADTKVLRSYEVSYELLDRDGCIAAEPGLAKGDVNFVGGLRLPDDETGDCHKFTNELATLAENRGVQFVFDCQVKRLMIEQGRVSHLETDRGNIHADVFLAAAGSYTPQLVRPLSMHLPVYPVKGYSITLPILDGGCSPVSTVLDESYKVAITRLGDRIRVGGTAEVNGFELGLPARGRETLELSVSSLFPGAGDLEQADFWCGLRPMTPDSTPVIGPTRIENLFLNTGHGTLGWTMACGSGRLIADLISNTKTPIKADDLSIARYA